jgi:hypothetical protein
MSQAEANLNLWAITSWLSRDEPHGHEFSIRVSPLFLRTAMNADYDEKKLQAAARDILRGVGEKVADYHECLQFGKWGVEAIDLFTNGKVFHLEQRSDDELLCSGGTWSSHNINHAHEQSLLMALWFMWASYIEAEVSSAI